MKRKQYGAEAGFADFQANEKKLDNQPIRLMAINTKWILDHIDYDKVIARRRENFQYLHKALAEKNQLQLPAFDTFACPMVHPYMVKSDRNIRELLIDNKVFVARYWPNVERVKGFALENDMANNVIPIPCDQRYNRDDMIRIVEIVNNKYKLQ